MNEFMDKKMLELFFEDTNEMLETSMDEILDLEDGFDKQILDGIMRSMHSIKGGSAMLELNAIESFSHKLEDIFIDLKEETLGITGDLIDLLIESLSILKKWLDHREVLLSETEEGFNEEIKEEREEMNSMLDEIIRIIDLEEKTGEVKEEKVKEEEIEEKESFIEGVKKINIVLDETSPMFEVKRTIINRVLKENGEIISSEPKAGNLLDNSVNYYKIDYKTELKDFELIKKLQLSGVLKAEILTTNKEQNTFKVEVYLDEMAPMFEVKRTIINKELVNYGEIKESFPSDILDNSLSYYKFIFETSLSKEELLKKLDITDIYFTCIEAGIEDITQKFKNAEAYLKRDMVLGNINLMYENLLEIRKSSDNIKIIIGEQRLDIYGIQLLEAFNKSL